MTKAPARLAISLSAVDSFRRCQQQYSYRYVERLRRRDRAPAPELGAILHDYLAFYYQALKDGEKPSTAHKDAQLAISAKYLPNIKKYSQVAHRAGADKLAVELLELPKKAQRITDRYYAARGVFDAERYEFLVVEEWVTIKVTKHTDSNGRLDLVARDRERDIVLLWEHKSTTDVPSGNYRLRDLQTPLYKNQIEEMGLCPPIDAVLWNYIHTKEPTEPELLKGTKKKPGGLTRRVNLDSTYEVYYEALKRNKLDPADYLEELHRLDGRELSVFFPRYEQVVLSDFDLLFRDYRQSARDIRRNRERWLHGETEPVRSLGRDCDWCEFAALCNAAILGGDDSDVRQLRYTVST